MRHDPQPDQPHVTLTSYIEGKSSQTLLEWLRSRFKYLTEEEWVARVASGAVKVNGREASPGQPLRAGDEVAYTTASWEEPTVNTGYRIVHEDEALVLVSKPAPLPTHAIGAYFKNTLMWLLRRDRPEARGWHPVHRLDSETSGLILLVKDPKYLKEMQKNWTQKKGHPHPVSGARSGSPPEMALSPQGRGEKGSVGSQVPSPLRGEGRAEARGEGVVLGVVKTYRAIVFGKFPGDRKVLEAPIGKKEGSKVRMKLSVILDKNPEEDHAHPERSRGIPVSGTSGPDGLRKDDGHPERAERVEGSMVSPSAPKPSTTEFTLLETKGDLSLLEVRPLTGRTHQIRVHLEHLGFPIVGDKLYSGDDETFLHFYEHDFDDWLKERVLLPRAALHAYGLEFTHPVTGKRMDFQDPFPEDLERFWGSLP